MRHGTVLCRRRRVVTLVRGLVSLRMAAVLLQVRRPGGARLVHRGPARHGTIPCADTATAAAAATAAACRRLSAPGHLHRWAVVLPVSRLYLDRRRMVLLMPARPLVRSLPGRRRRALSPFPTQCREVSRGVVERWPGRDVK